MPSVKLIAQKDVSKLERAINAALADEKDPRLFHSMTVNPEGQYVAVLISKPAAPKIAAIEVEAKPDAKPAEPAKDEKPKPEKPKPDAKDKRSKDKKSGDKPDGDGKKG